MVIKNLRTGKAYYFNDRKIYLSSSLVKLWVMAVVKYQVETKKISLDSPLIIDVSSLNNKLGLSEYAA